MALVRKHSLVSVWRPHLTVRFLIAVAGQESETSYPHPPCNSHVLVQATVGVGTVLMWYLILIQDRM